MGKGIQTQTAECLVIGEITNETLIVVLNKVDTLPIETRDEALEKVKRRVAKTLASTKFADAPMVAVSARPGGGLAAADEAGGEGGGGGEGEGEVEAGSGAPLGITELLETVGRHISVPQRDPNGPLLFAIDHCFPIKGQGTVLTGTVLSGAMRVGMEIDFPELKQQRKIKSMQMFHKPVNAVEQGDRVGVCVTQLDAKALERGIACTHGHVTLVSSALVSARQIRFFKAPCKGGSKFHFTVGHTTAMVTATFFGPPRPAGAERPQREAGVAVTEEDKAEAQARAVALARTPLRTAFDLNAEYEYHDELDADSPDEWAVIQFETPVPCAMPAVGIASHLDVATTSAACRLAFYGLMLRPISQEEVHALRVFKRKFKEGSIDRVVDANTVICKNLFAPGTDMNLFLGMSVQLGDEGPTGRIDSTFGKTKFKCLFPDNERGIEGLQEACHKAKLLLRYKRFVFDPKKRMIQTP